MKIKSTLLVSILIIAFSVMLPGTSAEASERIAFDASAILPPQLLVPGYTKIEMQSVSLNYGGGYSSLTSDFTAPRSGVYQLNTNVSIDTGGQDCSAFILSLFLNGNELRRLSRTEFGHQFEMAGSGVVGLVEDDVVDIRLFHNCGSPVVVEAGGRAHFNGAFLF
jgi:hypothetical protein